MANYNHKEIEAKWQKKWEESGIYKDYSKLKKFYALDMFPYPSGAGLHVGHPKGYIATDVVSRFKMLQGHSVLHPMGWDAFGLPAENYALRNKVHPRAAVEKNVARYKEQLKMFGFTYDWDREINTTDSEYYKWTQWIFLKMFEKGLAFESEEPVNWCPSCKTVLANEDLEGGVCERCGTQVEQKKMRQWVLKMTAYADRLLYDLDTEKLDWEEMILEQQRNWIGRSEGAEFSMEVAGTKEKVDVYTTRLDTVFGMTYAVVAPEHPVISRLKDKITNFSEVEKYQIQAQNKTEMERTALAKEKTGVELKGIKLVNPFTKAKIPLFVGDYVLGNYGTGAVMAVPAHDERDFEFALKHDLKIKQSIAANAEQYNKAMKLLAILDDIKKAADKENIKFWIWGGLACAIHARVIYREHDDIDLIVKNKADKEKLEKIFSSVGFSNFRIDEKKNNKIFSNTDSIEIELFSSDDVYVKDYDFINDKNFAESLIELNGFSQLVLSKEGMAALKENIMKQRTKEKDALDSAYLKGRVLTEDGVAVASDSYTGLTSEQARQKMTEWLEKEKIGHKKVNYKMRDWVFSRQRYWGEPIPIVHCDPPAGGCGTVPLPESELPLRLPDVESYEPTGTGESPLANITEWVNTKCPKCGGPAKRETNTMPQWAGSCWYYLRYIDPKNSQALIDKNKEKDWMPVDLYVGGAEHATRHLLYARFWHKFLYDIGVVSTKEPFQKLVHVGLINAEDGRKMSKRWNNVVNPDEIIEKYGADSIRLYEMFMGPFTQNIAWSTNGVIGVRRFLEKVWDIFENKKIAGECRCKPGEKCECAPEGLPQMMHKTIKKVTEDIENFRFNTAISQMMILANFMAKLDSMPRNAFEYFAIILSPFAPHMAEELWEKLGNKESIFKQTWPKYDPAFVKDETINLVLQVSGKIRDTVQAAADISEDEAKKLAMENENVKKWIEGKEVVKVIFVKGKLVNIVVK